MKKTINKALSWLLSVMMVFSVFVVMDTTSIQTKATGYDAQAAINYAKKYWKNYNTSYPNCNSIGGDCANFVSQCLYAGGLKQDSQWKVGASAWQYCPSMYDYFKTNGYKVIDYASASDIYPGNPVLYWNNNSGRWSHAAICTGYSGNTPLVTAHNKDHCDVEWTLGGSKYWGGSNRRATIIINSGSSPILPAPINNRSYSIPATVYASHKIYTYNEYGNQESNRWIDQGDKCYIDAIYVNDYVHVQYPTGGSSEPNRWTYAKLSDFDDRFIIDPKPTGYNIRVSSTSIYDCEPLTVTVTPFEDNFTNIRFYLVKPDGSVIPKDYGTTKSISLALNKTGVWKFYARVDNAYGSFEGSTSNGCMSVTVSRPNMGSKVDLGSDFYAYIVNKDSGNALTNDNDNVSSKTLQSTTTQRWHFKKQSDGSYQIQSVSGNGKCLDAYSGKGRSGDNVQVYKQNNEPVQQWWIYSAGSSVYYLMPTCSNSAVLDVYDASKTSGANVQIWAYNQTAAQKFEIRKIGAADISFSTSSVSLNLCGTNTSTVNITASGNLPSSYHYSANRNTSAMETTWGGWSGSTAPITIKGKKTGTYDLKISLVDGNTDQTLTTKTITVNISCSHNYGSWTTTKSPTCTADGTQQRKCSVCGNTETQTLKALGHSYTTSTVKPTCTSQGYTVHTCSRCSSSYTDNYTSAAGHSYGSWATTKQPTCTADGTKQRKCSACGNTETQTLKALGHDYSSSITRLPTCTDQGYTVHYCSRCSSSYTDNYTSATGHSFGSWTTTKQPTCTADGTKQRKCSDCGNTETQTIKATGHSYTTSIIQPTYTEQGYTLHTCSKCGHSYKDNYTNVLVKPLVNQSTISKKSTYVGGSIIVTAKASGGASPYKFAYYYKKSTDSAWTKIAGYSTAASKNFKPASAGTYTARVNVRDSKGSVVQKDFTVKVTAVLKNSSTISTTSVIAGTAVTLTGKASGGTSPYKFAYYYKKSTESTWTKAYVTASGSAYTKNTTVTFKPTTAGTYNVKINAKDNNGTGTVVSKEFTVTVKAAALANKSTVSTTSVTANTEVTLNGKAAGGTEPYKFAYYYKKSTESTWTKAYVTSSGSAYTKNTTVTFKPTTAGTYNVKINVKDNNGNGTVVSKEFAVTVKAASTALTNNSTVSATSITTGTKITLTAKASGGTVPYKYAYYYKKSTDSSWTKLVMEDGSAYVVWDSVGFTPKTAGTYNVRINVKDNNGTGKVVSKDFKVTVK